MCNGAQKIIAITTQQIICENQGYATLSGQVTFMEGEIFVRWSIYKKFVFF